MKILGIDPSLTRTGYAVLAGLEPGELVEAGYVTPGLAGHPAEVRAQKIACELEAVIKRLAVKGVIIESPANRPPRSQRGRGRKPNLGQAKYGLCVGVVWCWLGLRSYVHQERVVAGVEADPKTHYRLRMVQADVWASSSKAKRQAALAHMYPAYAAAITSGGDKGGDVGDAIGLARWEIERLIGAGQE